MKENVAIFWFRRDLRLEDNKGLLHSLRGDLPVLPIFIFDEHILNRLEDKDDARVSFIHDCLNEIAKTLKEKNKGIHVFLGKPIEVWKQIVNQHSVKTVYTNRDYEPYAQQRDKEVYDFLQSKQISFTGYKDHVIFEKSEVLSKTNNPYTVFTPYSKMWKSQLTKESFHHYQSESLIDNFINTSSNMLTLEAIGFSQSEISVPEFSMKKSLIQQYQEQRNLPFIEGTSRLSPHLRFGTISVREVCRKTSSSSETFLNEMIWRDFYSQVLYHNPDNVKHNFRRKYDAIEWRNNEGEFDKWCKGMTGFPIVDAGMRQLNETGWMHNRVRMITASFLCKDLLVDWRWGEAYFARKLLDFDLASNNGGWQWASGTGTDAAPYFRVFNPESQLKKFDPDLKYVKRWVPEYGTDDYPEEMVNHKEARLRALEVYKRGLG